MAMDSCNEPTYALFIYVQCIDKEPYIQIYLIAIFF